MKKLIHPLIMERKSVLAFSSRSLDAVQIRTLAEAASLAPSSFNQQPWRFIVARRENREDWNNMFGLLYEGNREWVQYAVPALILSLAERIPAGRKEENPYAWHDVGLATENLLLQAVSMGLRAHPMGGFDREKAKKILNIPENFQPVAMIALGYAGEDGGMPESLLERDRQERSRHSLNSFLFEGSWDRQIK